MACYLIETKITARPLPQVAEARYFLLHKGRKVLMEERYGVHAHKEIMAEVCDDLGCRGTSTSGDEWTKCIGRDFITLRSAQFMLEPYERIMYEQEKVRR